MEGIYDFDPILIDLVLNMVFRCSDGEKNVIIFEYTKRYICDRTENKLFAFSVHNYMMLSSFGYST